MADTITNKEAIALFEQIGETLPMNENGEIDAKKVREILSTNNSPAIKYICGKIPEFFLRGCGIFSPFYTILSDPKDDNDLPFDQQFMNKIKNGDFSDIERFEEIYPYLQIIAKAFGGDKNKLDFKVQQKIWGEDRLDLIKLGDDYLRCKNAYNQILRYDGLFEYNGTYLEERDIESEIKKHPEDQRYLEFALKTVKVYNMSKSDKIFKPFRPEELQREKAAKEETKKKIDKTTEELKELETKIAKYNFITSLTHKREKEADLKKKEEIQKEIDYLNGRLQVATDWIKSKEEEIEYSDTYKRIYFQTIRENILPEIKNKLSDGLDSEMKAKVDDLLDKIASRYFSQAVEKNTDKNPLILLGESLESFKDESYDEYIGKFYNSISTIAGLPNSFLNFEKAETKDLFTLLKAARNEMKKAPTDNDHGELKDEYRTHNLRSSFSTFMDSTVDYDKIELYLDNLNDEFKDLLKEENTDEYIKKVGIIWYKFMLIHPYTDGNGRVGRYMINILLAHKNIITSSLYYSLRDQYAFHDSMDEYVIKHFRPNDFDKVGEIFLKRIKETGYDLTTRKPLGYGQNLEIHPEEIESGLHM